MPQTQGFPLPGTSTLYVLDRINILGVDLPLAGPIEGGLELDIEKRKEPGSDYSTYVSHGIDATPIRIRLLLFRDLISKKDWFAEYAKIKDRLVGRFLSTRNAVPVFHPLLNEENINQIVFVKRSMLTQQRGLLFTVTLEGFNPKSLRIGSGAGGVRFVQDTNTTSRASDTDAMGRSKVVSNNPQATTRPTEKQNAQNVTTPGQKQAGKDRRPT